jgi:transposase InsO family protein
VGWAMAQHMRAELVVEALEMAIWQRRPDVGLVHHSVSGSETGACIRDYSVDAIEEKSKGQDLEVCEVESGELRVDRVGDAPRRARFTIPLPSPSAEGEDERGASNARHHLGVEQTLHPARWPAS